MSWLDKLKIIGMAVMTVVPGAQPFIPFVLAGITIAEESKEPGKKKREIAKQVVKLTADTVNTIKPGTVDVAQADATFEAVTDAIIATTNQVHNIPVKP